MEIEAPRSPPHSTPPLPKPRSGNANVGSHAARVTVFSVRPPSPGAGRLRDDSPDRRRGGADEEGGSESQPERGPAPANGPDGKRGKGMSKATAQGRQPIRQHQCRYCTSIAATAYVVSHGTCVCAAAVFWEFLVWRAGHGARGRSFPRSAPGAPSQWAAPFHHSNVLPLSPPQRSVVRRDAERGAGWEHITSWELRVGRAGGGGK